MEINRFEIVESTKKYNGLTACSLQKCNIVVNNKVVSTLTLETKLDVGNSKNSKKFFTKETDVFLEIVTSLGKKSGLPVYNSVKI